MNDASKLHILFGWPIGLGPSRIFFGCNQSDL